MRNKNKLFLLCLLAPLLQACDSGDIIPKENDYEKVYVSVSGSFTFKGTASFPENYQILYVTYANSSDKQALSYQEIAQPKEQEVINISFANLPEKATGVGIWLVEQTKQRKIVALYQHDFTQKPTDDVLLGTKEINLLAYDRVQQQVFNQCIGCHGGGTSAASGMYLTEDKSYDNVVNVPSVHQPAKMRIAPNSTLNSYLIDVLQGTALATVHASLSSLKDDDVTLVEEWVKEGAAEE